MFRTIILAAGAAIALAGSASAQTADQDSAPSVTIQFADLDLGHQAGARVMFQRIQTAAVVACGGQSDLQMLERRQLFDSCRKQTITRALDQLHAPLVTAMGGQPAPVLLSSR